MFIATGAKRNRLPNWQNPDRSGFGQFGKM
jgi:hypothetical protein